MYRHCVYCSAHLGANEAVEAFPVGSTLAFDGARGRLWAVCPRCARWNLAPIEERWEAVEEAEIRFGRAGLRVQRENVGLAKLADGSKLIRVGPALPVEVAAWRYGGEMVRRRWGYVGWFAVMAGAPLLPAPVVAAGVGAVLVHAVLTHPRDGRLKLPGHAAAVLRAGVDAMRLVPSEDGRLALGLARPNGATDGQVLTGDVAMQVLARALPWVNRAGAGRGELRQAVELIEARGGADAYTTRMPGESPVPVRLREPPDGFFQTAFGRRRRDPGPYLAREGAIALEIAVNEQRERRAMDGELALIESAWREAEQVAALADRLAAQLSGMRIPGRGGGLPAPAAAQ